MCACTVEMDGGNDFPLLYEKENLDSSTTSGIKEINEKRKKENRGRRKPKAQVIKRRDCFVTLLPNFTRHTLRRENFQVLTQEP